jgi:Uma2 family endonuclease
VSAAAPVPRRFEDLYAEIQALPEGASGQILDPGRVHVTMGRPGRAHRFSFKLVLDGLGRFDRDRGGSGWWIEPEPEIRFGERLLDPDIAGWRVERVPEMPATNPIAVAPDWVCEILSPTTARIDRQMKLPRYIREGVAWVWLVDPVARLVEVYREGEERLPLLATSAGEADRVSLPPFDGELDVGAWWLSDEPASAP